MNNVGENIEFEQSMIVKLPAVERKQILAYWVKHTDKERHFFKWDWSMIWLLVKYKIIWGMDITFTVTKAIDREEYFVQFYAE
jgi:hypothetical protein